MTVTIRDIIEVMMVMATIFYVMVVTMVCYNSDSDNKRWSNDGDSDSSWVLSDNSDNDLL